MRDPSLMQGSLFIFLPCVVYLLGYECGAGGEIRLDQSRADENAALSPDGVARDTRAPIPEAD